MQSLNSAEWKKVCVCVRGREMLKNKGLGESVRQSHTEFSIPGKI